MSFNKEQVTQVVQSIRTCKRDVEVAQAPKEDINLFYGMYYRFEFISLML